MDQSTQVDFPTISRSQLRQIKRHNTSGDLFYSNHRNPAMLSNSWCHIKTASPRPKSLNMSTDTFSRIQKYNSESPISRISYPSSDIPLGSISRERTPPFSCNSSIISSTGYKPPPYVPPKGKHPYPDEESNGSTSKYYCKCCDVESGPRFKRDFSNTPEGLSWRRLHMSRAKLKATATTSELLSGFAMIAMVELQINEKTSVPEWLFVIFAVCTTVLVAVHIFALMISTYILPNIDAIAKLEICEIVTESPHERLRGLIELAWAFSTILGLFLFLVEVAILCWVKFWDYSFTAAIAATVIVVPVLIIFVLFAVHYYHSLVVYKCNTSISDMQKLEDMKKQLDEVVSNKLV